MKVTRFAEELGLPASKVRYYDQKGLIRGAREENNYRQFTPLDALDIYHAQMLRSFDMSIQQSLEAKSATLAEVDGWVAVHEEELAESIRLQQMKLFRLREMRAYMTMLEKGERLVHLERMEDSYQVWNFGAVGPLSPLQLQTVRILAEAMPFSYIAIRVGRESLLSVGEELDVSIGLGILESNREKLKLEIPREFKCGTGAFSTSFLFESADPFHLKKKELRPLLEDMEQRGKPVEEDLVGRVFFSYRKNNAFVHGIGLGVTYRS